MGTLSALVRLDKRYLSPVEDLDHSFSILPLVQMASVPGIGVLPSTLKAKDSAIYQGDTFSGNQQQGITGGRHNKNYLFNINVPGSSERNLFELNLLE
ncbi:hypothetical protein CVT26_002305 [Gymnopilus dilepis]|uniref:Uncharacterized protein n=1 Tax=Gymnopilus dilepis TaxID=231916 RepID=A0A409WEB8_9AGAR|nr:hypothetical protein CVT26_002305 [Gymnopilus dilepis]